MLTITHIGKYRRTAIPIEVNEPRDLKEDDETEWIPEYGKVVIGKHMRGEINGSIH